MGSVVPRLTAAFRLSLAKRAWAYFGISFVLYYIALLIVEWVAAIPLFFLLGSSAGPPWLFAALISNPVSVAPALVVAGIVFLVLTLLCAAVFVGLQFNGARNFMRGMRGISALFSESWRQTRQRLKTLFLVSLLVSLVFLLLFALLFFPVASDFMAVLAAGNVAAVPGIMLSGMGLFLLFILLMLIVYPITSIIYPVALFESHAAGHTIKRAINLGITNYLRNLGYLILMWLVLLLGFLLYALAVLIAILLLLIPVLGWFLGFLILVGGSIVFVLWIISFMAFAMVHYYDLVSGNNTATTAFPASPVVLSSPIASKAVSEKKSVAKKSPVKKPVPANPFQKKK